MKRKTLFLIDGNSFCYRAFYAIRELATSKGEPTNAVYGFLNMLRKIINGQKPDYLAVAMDSPGATFRHERYEEYKVRRKPMPDSLSLQIPKIKDVLKAYRIPVFEKAGYEADDILATIAARLKGRALDIIVASGDKDMLQIVDDNIKVYNPRGEGEIIDAQKVKERFGVEPLRIADYIALSGDATDNIPGVKGIGEKTAAKLLGQFKSLEAVYENLDEIESKAVRRMLTESREMAAMSKELARVDENAPVEIDLEEMKIKEPDRHRLTELFRELEFRALLKEVAPAESEAACKEITTKGALEAFLKEVSRSNRFSFHVDAPERRQEGREGRPSAQVGGCAFCVDRDGLYYVPRTLLGDAAKIFEDARIQKIGHDVKSQKILFLGAGVAVRQPYFDVKVASYLLNPQRPNHDLEDIALEYLGHGVGEKPSQKAHAAFKLAEILDKNLDKANLSELFYQIEMPLVGVLADMERTGVAIDVRYLKELSEEMSSRLNRLAEEVYEIAGCQFNINSPKQLSGVLFEKLNLPVIKRGKTGPSTDVEVMQELAQQHALPAVILKYRELAKLKSTYVDALPELINPETGRVHTSFNQTVTATGRLSSSEPNLQNIPVRTKEGQKIRRAFIPGKKEDVLLSADYSQIELRILAHLSKDPSLIEAFEQDRDIHVHTASLIFGVSQDEVSPAQRSIAKTVNFGIVYGMSAYGLSKELDIETTQAQEFIDAYFARYPKVREYLDKQIEHARRYEYVTTLFKRRRHITEINSDNMNVRSFGERTAINTPVQGSAADLIKVAMINVHGELAERGLKSRMILQVHDELVFEVPGSELDTVAGIVKGMMENAVKLCVPVKVKLSAGKNWLEMEERK